MWLVLLLIIAVVALIANYTLGDSRHEPQLDILNRRDLRRNYYRNIYLKSPEWQRKRYVVLKRDGWRCVYCGAKATQVHHKRYAKWNVGKEPIEWLVSICKTCHDSIHRHQN